jgi:hypothetical protein
MQKATRIFLLTLFILTLSSMVTWAAPPSQSKVAQTPFQKQVELKSDEAGTMGLGTISVPVGQRLVIQFFSGSMSVLNVDVIGVSIAGYFNGELTQHRFVVTRQGTYDAHTVFNTCQLTKMYFDPGQDLQLIYINSDQSLPGANNQGVVTVTGYLETVDKAH